MRGTEKHTEEGHTKTGSDCSDTATSQGVPRVAGGHQMLRKGKEEFFPRAFTENTALPIP